MGRLPIHVLGTLAALTMLACSNRETAVSGSSLLSRITLGSEGEEMPAPVVEAPKKKKARKDAERMVVATPDLLDAPLAGDGPSIASPAILDAPLSGSAATERATTPPSEEVPAAPTVEVETYFR
jgi:hypothetical protein